MIQILSKKIHSCASVVPDFLAHPTPQSHLVGLRKVVKHPHIRYTDAVILNSIISTENIVDAVIDAVAMQYTSTPPHLHTSTNHDYKISRDQDVGFPSSFRSNTSHSLEEEQAKFQHILDEFAGKSNVSSRMVASSSMLHFVHSIIDIGISLGRASPIITSESLFPFISAKKVTKMIRSSAEARAEEILYQYQGKRFVNLI
jgi:hypothetical protein